MVLINHRQVTTCKFVQKKLSFHTGDFGRYQIAVVIFAALRAMSCAMDGLSGPFLAPTVRQFECDMWVIKFLNIPFMTCWLYFALIDCNRSLTFHPLSCSDRISQKYPNFVNTSDCKFTLASADGRTANYMVDEKQCFFREADGGPDRLPCTKWSFDNPVNIDYMNSLTVEVGKEQAYLHQSVGFLAF